MNIDEMMSGHDKYVLQLLMEHEDATRRLRGKIDRAITRLLAIVVILIVALGLMWGHVSGLQAQIVTQNAVIAKIKVPLTVTVNPVVERTKIYNGLPGFDKDK